MFKFSCSLIILSITLLTGCASKIDQSRSVASVNQTNPLDDLRNISIEARDELRLLAKTTQAINDKKLSSEQRKQRLLKATVVQPGFEQLVTFNYWGEAEEAFNAIALIAGYEAIVIDGIRPISPVMVRFNLANQPLHEALLELGAQTGDLINIDLFPSAKVMQFTYVKK